MAMGKGSTDNAALLSRYVELMSKHGRDSKPARNFRKQHAGNREMVKAMTKAHDTHAGGGGGPQNSPPNAS